MDARLYLTGLSFTGKSSIGPLVARQLNWTFLDTDDLIVAQAGKPIAAIFADDGEAAFRAREREALRTASQNTRAVIATGGGAITDPANRNLMLESGFVVCLDARPETLVNRLQAQQTAAGGEVRPLLQADDPLQRFARLKADRQAAYAAVHWTVPTDLLTPDEAAEEVVRGWRYFARRTLERGGALDGAACWVHTADQSYPIYVGWGELQNLGKRMREVGLSGVAHIITDSNVVTKYGAQAEDALRAAGFEADSFAIPAGEHHKTLETVQRCYAWLAGRRAERGHTIVALGGGVVGDLAGYVAATYLRGIAFVQAPTSLLAMVDASVGGKVAVDLPEGKNLVGAFYQPRLVLADVAVLQTLPSRERTEGWAEVIKHGFITSPEECAWLDQHAEQLLALEPETTTQAIRESMAIKARVVSADPKERSLRMILNYGHTIGHALEAATHYTRLLHGEAVAVGMVGAARIGAGMGLLSEADVQRHIDMVRRFGLPTSAPDVPIEDVMSAMSLDKKVSGRTLRWVLLHGIGRPAVHNDVPMDLVIQAVEGVRYDN